MPDKKKTEKEVKKKTKEKSKKPLNASPDDYKKLAAQIILTFLRK